MVLDLVGRFLLLVRDMRNLIEQPKPERFIEVHNFRLLLSVGGELTDYIETVVAGEADDAVLSHETDPSLVRLSFRARREYLSQR